MLILSNFANNYLNSSKFREIQRNNCNLQKIIYFKLYFLHLPSLESWKSRSLYFHLYFHIDLTVIQIQFLEPCNLTLLCLGSPILGMMLRETFFSTTKKRIESVCRRFHPGILQQEAPLPLKDTMMSRA